MWCICWPSSLLFMNHVACQWTRPNCVTQSDTGTIYLLTVLLLGCTDYVLQVDSSLVDGSPFKSTQITGGCGVGQLLLKMHAGDYCWQPTLFTTTGPLCHRRQAGTEQTSDAAVCLIKDATWIKQWQKCAFLIFTCRMQPAVRTRFEWK